MKFANLDAYVKAQEGQRVLKKVLLANNGIAAVKCIRSVRRWSYETFGNEKEIEFIAMATPEDLKANAEYIRMADSFVEVPAGSNANNYANVSLICQLAERFEVDGVWAGWGHASENPSLPRTLKSMNITFIGPPAEPMYALGDKIGSTIIAQSAKVPTIAWNGQDLIVNYKEEGDIEPELYNKANIATVEDCIAAVERVGLPVMIKASEGGGGKGIRKVNKIENVATAYRQVQSEVLGSPIFVMKLAPKSRHLEVQLLADEFGNAIALNGRDCSVQRRHQKILEEGPPIAAPPSVWLEMEKAAVRLAKEVGYVNAGTVEYLFCEDDGEAEFFFLELNPRLQVEHPVTEMITGVNLPALQMNVAMGLRLDRIPEIRELYGFSPLDASVIDFDNCKMRPPMGHVIAARITAENPFDGFTPTSGKIRELNFRSSRNVWGYFSVDSSGNVHEFADSQFGHLFSWGQNREQARRNLVLALKDISIRGEIRTTVEYLNDMIEAEDYVANKIDTAWLDGRIRKKIKPASIDKTLVALIGAACQSFLTFKNRREEFVNLLNKGRMPEKELLERSLKIELILEGIKYVMHANHSGAGSIDIECNDTSVAVGVRELTDGGFLVSCGGKSNLAYFKKEVSGIRMELNSQTYIFAEEYDPTRLRAKMGGKLLRYLVQNGSRVEKNQPFAEIEVMKMNMQVLTQETGLITLLKPVGSVMEPGDIMCTMEVEDESKIQKAQIYEGSLPSILSNYDDFLPSLPHSSLESAKKILESVLEGYIVKSHTVRAAIEHIRVLVSNPMLPVLALEEILARVKNSIPIAVFKNLAKEGTQVRESISSTLTGDKEAKFSETVVGLNNLSELIFEQTKSDKRRLQELLALSERYSMRVASILDVQFKSDAGKVNRNNPDMVELYNMASNYRYGAKIYLVNQISERIRSFCQTEKIFADLQLSDSAEKDDEMQELRRLYQDDLEYVHRLSLSHSRVSNRNKLVISLLGLLEEFVREEEDLIHKELKKEGRVRGICVSLLRTVATLKGEKTTDVALEGRTLLLELQQKSYKQQLLEIEEKLSDIENGNTEVLQDLISQVEPLLHFLISIVCTSSSVSMKKLAMELYIRRVYANYDLESISSSDLRFSKFSFKAEAIQQVAPLGKSLQHATSYEDLTTILTFNESQDSESAEQRSETSFGLNIDDDESTSINRQVNRGRIQSLDEVVPIPADVSREGIFAQFKNVEELESSFEEILRELNGSCVQPVNVVHALVRLSKWPGLEDSEQNDRELVARKLQAFVQSARNGLESAGVRRVTFAVFPEDGMKGKLVSGHGCGFYTFRHRSGFVEDKIVRDIETTFAFQLDLPRLSNFSISLVPLGKNWNIANHVNVYRAVPKHFTKLSKKNILSGKRYFVRALIRQTKKMETDGMDLISALDSYPGPEKVFNACLSALEAVQKPSHFSTQNHIFLNFLSNHAVDPTFVERVIKSWTLRYSKRLRAAGVSEVELKFVSKVGETNELPMRFICGNPTGFAMEMSRYIEAGDPTNPSSKCFFAVNDLSLATAEETEFVAHDNAELHGLPLSTPYKIRSVFDEKRARATRVGTAYVYDYPTLFLKALQLEWKNHMKALNLDVTQIPDLMSLVSSEEMILSEEEPEGRLIDDGLVFTRRPLGENLIGMVAWRLKLITPEYPNGRYIVVIANDITIKAGSFGTEEDELFFRASKYARREEFPRIYIAANSGARIGLADQIKSLFKVKLKDAEQPERGFDYIYLDQEEFSRFGPEGSNAVQGEWIAEEKHYKITTVIGNEKNLGVENLRGSGKIAGETSRAYEETFTLTYVSGRSVGIGAYLVRLGQRTIQKGTNAPIILTGYNALNALMGKEVYTSNLQLGGTKVMYNNGVSHLCVRNDLEGVQEMITWLSFLPERKNDPIKATRISIGESVTRPVTFCPKELKLASFDPRSLLEGTTLNGDYFSGFCDKGTFKETLAGWAKTVVVGRGRLGGLPLGIIVSETRTVEKTAPADPAAPDSAEQVVQQAGQVWFPDSAYKTAQAISDLNREGLPLMIFANWRGFSGGQRDMFDEVLKFGSFIVDELVDYKQPVFVYIIPTGELRGGAWVVVDETINAETMEMYADKEARGNVLEPAGAASIKFRKPDIMRAMHRTDDTLKTLKGRLSKLEEDPVDNVNEIVIAESEIKEREQLLFPVYKQIASHFVDLHDRPGRMKEKGVIREIIAWKDSRTFFFHKLQRRLWENELLKEIRKARKDNFAMSSLRMHLANLLKESKIESSNDRAVYEYFSSDNALPLVNKLKSKLLFEAMFAEVYGRAQQDKNMLFACFQELVAKLQQDGQGAIVNEMLEKLRM